MPCPEWGMLPSLKRVALAQTTDRQDEKGKRCLSTAYKELIFLTTLVQSGALVVIGYSNFVAVIGFISL